MRREIFDEHRPALPDHKEHHCTDPIFLALFLLALGGMGYTQVYAYRNGDTRKLVNGINWDGKVCGVDTNGSYLYWCKDASGQELAFKDPICVESCPTNQTAPTTTTECYDPLTHFLTRIDAYATKRWGTVCVPAAASLKAMVKKRVLGRGNKIQPAVHSVFDSWVIITSSGVVGIGVGYAYLFLLSIAAKPLVQASMVFMVIGPFCLGCYWIYIGFFPPEGSWFDDRQMNFIWGASSLCISLVFALVACCFLGGLDTATKIVEASCECMFAEGSLLLEPFIALVVKFVTLGIMCGGLLALISCGKVRPTGQVGILRTWELSLEEKIYLSYSLFMLVWMLELGTAVSQYVLAWATQLWYFTPNDADGEKRNVQPCAICSAYINCLRFHLGTCALGSLLIAALRCLRYVMQACARMAEAEGNCIGSCIAKVCICCITCAKEFAMMLTKTAYMHVAITSEDFLHSAKSAMGIIAEEVPVIAILNGAQSVFMVLGVAVVSSVPAGLTYIVCSRVPAFTSNESDYFVEYPKVVALASALFNAVIGLSFMLVFDTVGDTILYCFAMDERRNSSFQGMFSGGYDSETSEEEDDEPGFFGWLFGAGEEVKNRVKQQMLDPRVDYAPRKLRDLIEEHKVKAGLS